jgi:transcriptional regulator with GAF, ATPase, and Fis domain
MEEILTKGRLVAQSDANVLIQGEAAPAGVSARAVRGERTRGGPSSR